MRELWEGIERARYGRIFTPCTDGRGVTHGGIYVYRFMLEGQKDITRAEPRILAYMGSLSSLVRMRSS